MSIGSGRSPRGPSPVARLISEPLININVLLIPAITPRPPRTRTHAHARTLPVIFTRARHGVDRPSQGVSVSPPGLSVFTPVWRQQHARHSSRNQRCRQLEISSTLFGGRSTNFYLKAGLWNPWHNSLVASTVHIRYQLLVSHFRYRN